MSAYIELSFHQGSIIDTFLIHLGTVYLIHHFFVDGEAEKRDCYDSANMKKIELSSHV